MKKIDLWVNDIYICTSSKYTRCKDFKEAVRKDGFVRWSAIPKDGFYKIEPNDKIVCKFQK